MQAVRTRTGDSSAALAHPQSLVELQAEVRISCGTVAVDRELYLPKIWTSDRERSGLRGYRTVVLLALGVVSASTRASGPDDRSGGLGVPGPVDRSQLAHPVVGRERARRSRPTVSCPV
jgi:hypothetical protein